LHHHMLDVGSPCGALSMTLHLQHYAVGLNLGEFA
jgi:hypothetical protein